MFASEPNEQSNSAKEQSNSGRAGPLANFYRRYSFRLAFVLIGIGLVGAGIFIVRDMRSTDQAAREIYGGLVGGLDLIGDLQYQTQEARRSMLYALTTDNSNLQIVYVDDSRAADGRVGNMIAEYLDLAHSAGEIDIGKRFERDWGSYLEIRDEVISSILEGSIKDAVARDLEQGVPAFNRVRDDLQEIKQLYKRQAEQKLSAVQSSSNKSLLKMILLLSLAQLLAAIAIRAVQRSKMLGSVQRSEARLREVIESINDGMCVIGQDSKVELWNSAAERIAGRSRERVIGRPLGEVFPATQDTPLPAAIREAERSRRAGAIEDLRFAGDTRRRVFQAHIFPFDSGITIFFNDVTERHRAEEALRKSELEYRNLFESAGDAILIYEPQNKTILEANNRACEVYGFKHDELVGRSLCDLTKDYRGNGRRVAERDYKNFETIHYSKNGEPIDMLISSSNIEYGGREAVLSINRDISKIKRLQQQLVQAEKLAALGQLVAGVAHELNNPLTSVIGHAQLVLRKSGLSPQIKDFLEIINKEADRTRRIVRNLLSFSRQYEPDLSEVDLNQLLNEILRIRAHEMESHNIEVCCELGHIPQVMIDAHQLQQVFLNIIVNAEQAMLKAGQESHDGQGGVLTIKTELVEVDQKEWVRVVISDNGPGIAPEILGKVFDPFFTTKEVGVGTGLGLSISYGIVKEHGGTIQVKSAPGAGASFVIELPAS